jgi:hypothetical protein
MKPKLTLADFVRAAALLQCEVAAIRAVAKKESSGGGFLKGRILTVRFEGHIFEQKTGRRFSRTHPTLSHPYMRNCPYNKGTISDWRRLEAARQLGGDVAFECASYGLFQIMGFHYAMLGYDSAYAMVQAFNESEGKQLDGFCMLIRKKGWAVYLRKLMFDAFALRYNGKDHAANNYGPDMQAYYDEFRA